MKDSRFIAITLIFAQIIFLPCASRGWYHGHEKSPRIFDWSRGFAVPCTS